MAENKTADIRCEVTPESRVRTWVRAMSGSPDGMRCGCLENVVSAAEGFHLCRTKTFILVNTTGHFAEKF